MEVLNDVLNNNVPGIYDCDYWEATIYFNDILVHVPNRTFTVKQGNFSADLVMGTSKGDSSFNESYSESFSAKGKFDFRNADKLIINEIESEIESDIYWE